jgi:radical SAM-linked protein
MRIRLTFSKTGAMQYVGHLDLHRSWERTFRRSGLPLAYSLGFHPQPRLNLACALPVGFTSQCEILDAWLEQEIPIDQIRESVSAALPPGLEMHDLEIIDLQAPALQTQVTSAVYVITFFDDILDLDTRVQRIISADHLPRVRRDRSYDLRPLIEEITLLPQKNDEKRELRLQLAAREAATGRPEELLDEMAIQFENTHVHREKLILTRELASN